MSTEELHEKIKNQWAHMDGKQDLLNLLNLANYGLYGEKAKDFSLKQLIYHSRPSINKKRYTSFKIPKKKPGEYRFIDAPNPTLRSLQRSLNYALQVIYTPHPAAMGFAPGRSIVSNALVHTGQNYVYNIDLRNFFPSIPSGRVYARMQTKPFSCSKEAASLIADLCCYTNFFGKVLPQGAPTSPTLTNIICERLDYKLSRLAKAYGLNYSRYADDITFSGKYYLFSEDGNFCKALQRIIHNEENFGINTDKTRVYHSSMRQEVTGITVNEKTNVARTYIKQLRTMLHNWEVKGYEEAQSEFLKIYNQSNTKHHLAKGKHHIENIIAGKLLYLKMVKGEDDTTYKKLYERFEKLIEIKYGKVSTPQENNVETPIVIEDKLPSVTINLEGKGDDILVTFAELEALLTEEPNA